MDDRERVHSAAARRGTISARKQKIDPAAKIKAAAKQSEQVPGAMTVWTLKKGGSAYVLTPLDEAIISQPAFKTVKWPTADVTFPVGGVAINVERDRKIEGAIQVAILAADRAIARLASASQKISKSRERTRAALAALRAGH